VKLNRFKVFGGLNFSPIMLFYTLFKIGSVTSIERIIGKPQDINVKHKNILILICPTSLKFRGTHFWIVGKSEVA
jgi:hypothetical protein